MLGPRSIAGLLEILLEKDPCRRFQRPAELVEAVAKILEPDESWVTTDLSGSKRTAVHLDEFLRTRRAVISDVKTRASVWLLAAVVGVLGLVFVWHSLPAHVKSFLGSGNKPPSEKSIAVLPF
jgi:hypothetical protein